MPHISFSKVKGQEHDKAVKVKIFSFLEKLAADDTTVGLNIEKMQNAADQRARTARVDQGLRAVLYRLDVPGEERTYVYAGTWQHDVAIERARKQILQRNPINGVAEFIDATVPEADEPPPVVTVPTLQPKSTSVLMDLGYLLEDLTGELGFDDATAKRIFSATTDDQLLRIAESFENQWQNNAVLALAVGDAISKIRADLGFDKVAPVEQDKDEDEQLAESLRHPASRMQFAFIENEDELRRVIEGGDFGAWRVFLHPEQRTYAEKDYNGPFRLTGGAGTGKTVVLLHRAARLAAADPGARIILTTYTKALSAALERDLERLDPTTPKASKLAESGVLVRGIDALAVAVRDKAGAGFTSAAAVVFGTPMEPRASLVSNEVGWREAIEDADVDLPDAIKSSVFFEGEYLQVILPHRITNQADYFQVRRPGRGVALDRRKRAAVWQVVEQYRQTGRLLGRLSWAENASLAAVNLETDVSHRVADHVLIDEAQDLTPSHWQLLRALANEGKNDLFIAEDTHQRIYGQHVVLSRYGIKVTGRSRRLTLNYRTTQQNLRYALGVLEGGHYVDSEESEEMDHGYRSSRSGPVPEVLESESKPDQYDKVADTIKRWLADGTIRPETIAVLTRSRGNATDLKNQLIERGVTVTDDEAGTSGIKHPLVMTMHKAKGLEFSRVLLFDVSEGVIPNAWALKGVAEEEMADAMLRERSLLYVAASRARDELVVSWAGKPSELLAIESSASNAEK